MFIHVVQPGETIYSIANSYRISVKQLIRDNVLTNPYNLVVGQTIVIVYPAKTYTIQEGDTLESIANAFGITELDLLRNNPVYSNNNNLYPGEIIVISYDVDKIMKISTNGYVNLFIDKAVLRKTLPFLTYITIFSYLATSDGNIIQIDDNDIIQLAKNYDVAPLMLLTTFSVLGNDAGETAHTILHSKEIQNRLIDNILTNLKEKGYYGLNIDSQDVPLDDRQLYLDFVANATKRLKEEGYKVFFTLNTTTLKNQPELFYGSPEYEILGQAANEIMYLNYEWGSTIRSPLEVPPISWVRENLEIFKTQIPPEKTALGFPIISYDWELPYVSGVSNTQALSFASTIDLAVEVGTIIQFDEVSQSPYFYYIVNAGDKVIQHVVRFKDARSIDVLVSLVPEYGLNGIGIWNIMSYFAQMWLVINSQYEIEKIVLDK